MSKLMQSIFDPRMTCCAGIFTLKWNILGIIFFACSHIRNLLFHLMCIHVPEWICNLLSFFSLVFADGCLRSARTFGVILAIFIQAWTTRAPCRFLRSACIVTATNLKDFRMSLILENKILKKETLKTTRKSSLYFIPREQCFHQ